MTDEWEIGSFLFGLKAFKHTDGRLEYRIQSVNENIPIEVIIMQLKAFVSKLEKSILIVLNVELSNTNKTLYLQKSNSN